MLFFSLALSEDCPVSDPKVLMWEYTLPEIVKLQELVEIRGAISSAVRRDDKLKQEVSQKA